MNDWQRFLSKVTKTKSCWIWNASIIQNSGYGRFWMNGNNLLAHRASWLIFKAETPGNKVVMHKCDNSKCVNPEHLLLGTHKENTMDMIKKGRCNPPIGERGARKLKTRDIIKIRDMYKAGALQKEIAKKFNIHQTFVSQILLNKRWSHVR